MRDFFIQFEKWLRITAGGILFPFVLLVFFLKAGTCEYNFSAILTMNKYCLAAHTAAFIMLAWVIRCFIHLSYSHTDDFMILLFALFCTGALLIPYIEGSSLPSSLHLLCAYCACFLFIVFIYKSMSSAWQRVIYSQILILFFFLCIKAGDISGEAELVLSIGSSMMLAWLSRR